jgi:flavin reductase (DIM6/NTAB) family NADH-FMN oxidoreductase RutF
MAVFTFPTSAARERRDTPPGREAGATRLAPGVDAERLRLAMGQFTTGVTVITTRDGSGQAFGTTANAVSSVSLSPPLVLACLRQESETLAALLERRRFAINVLQSSQAELSDRFARRSGPDTWDAVAHRSVEGIPLLEGAIATLECELHDLADGGDHAVVVGHVVALEHAQPDADPLVFYAGSYRRIDMATDLDFSDHRE